MGLLNKFRSEEKKKSLEEEVADNLTALLNTKESFGAIQKGLGLKTYSSCKSRDDIFKDLAADIQYNIDTFEKRIKLIEIQPLKDENSLVLRLQIKCQLGERFHSFYVGFSPFQEPIQVEVDHHDNS